MAYFVRIRRKCASPKTTRWSTHSRRIDPISLSAKPFCQGEPGAMGLSRLPMVRNRCYRRIPNKQIFIEEIAASEHDRNANHTKADWQFTTKNARIKLKHLYPSNLSESGDYNRWLFGESDNVRVLANSGCQQRQALLSPGRYPTPCRGSFVRNARHID